MDDAATDGRTPTRIGPLHVAAATVLAWAGFFVHNIADLPGQTLASSESLLPTVVWLVAAALWLLPGTRRAGAWSLLVWSTINLVGAVLSVLPLPFLPFEPEQTVRHYAFHGVYLLSQLPLIAATWIWLHSLGERRRA